MTTLFKQLSKEQQQRIRDTKNSHLMITLKSKCYPIDLTIGEMYHLSQVFDIDYGVTATFKLFGKL